MAFLTPFRESCSMSSVPAVLAPHPRLYLGPSQLARLKDASSHPVVDQAARQVDHESRRFVRYPVFDSDWNAHNHAR